MTGKVVFKNVNKIYSYQESEDLKGKFFGPKKGRNSKKQGIKAVKDFSLSIEDREFIVLVGPSGCGKSTTLRMLAGLEDISFGEILIDDHVINDMASKDRDIAMVFQNYSLYPHMTVRENMEFPLELKKIPKNEIVQKVNKTAEILDLIECLDRKPSTLSGGQKQRVAIGRAIVREPKVLLMDEPLSNLDAKLRNEMRSELIKLRKRIDSTFVYVTHDQTEAMTLGDRIVVMNGGVIQQIGKPQDIFEKPNNIFVAEFIGLPKINFYDAKLEKREDGYHVLIGGAYTKISERLSRILENNQVSSRDVILGIRPNYISFGNDKEIKMEGTVILKEMIGSEAYIHIESDYGETIIAMPTFDMDSSLDKDTYINFTFNTDMINIFDIESGENLILERSTDEN